MKTNFKFYRIWKFFIKENEFIIHFLLKIIVDKSSVILLKIFENIIYMNIFEIFWNFLKFFENIVFEKYSEYQQIKIYYMIEKIFA
jgi:hypothetical protein